MKEKLDQFAQSLDPATSPRLRKAITDTTQLLGGTTETVDVRVQKLYDGKFDREIGGQQYRHPRVLSATLATCATFLALESSAPQTGFLRYRELLWDLFP